ncbi:MAG: DUF4918 family protein [Bacteroidota bacterium]|nr:DUF4918 family protein [Bacteroidota bacterium]
MTLAERIITFNRDLNFDNDLPEGIHVLNPFKENNQINDISAEFYRKFYNDNKSRHIIMGINPGRFGAGTTGIPFTDTVRLKEKCGINIESLQTYELSSVFVYDVIQAYGGVSKFYSDYYITSVCPLGFTKTKENGNHVNYNFYDNKQLTMAVNEFIIMNIRKQLEMGIDKDVCFCLGTGKNSKYLIELNKKEHFFDKIIPLEHPRYIMQYKLKARQEYVDKYIRLLKNKMF